MDYTISKTVNKTFGQAINKLTEALKQEGFGVITESDVKEKFKEKLGIDFRNYKILGACNPALAHKAIQQGDKIGVMLPCNVLVQEQENSEVEVAAVNSLSSIGVVGNDTLQSLAAELTEKLKTRLIRFGFIKSAFNACKSCCEVQLSDCFKNS